MRSLSNNDNKVNMKKSEPLVFSHMTIGPAQIRQLTEELGVASWYDILSSDQVDKSYDNFVKHINILNSCGSAKTTNNTT